MHFNVIKPKVLLYHWRLEEVKRKGEKHCLCLQTPKKGGFRGNFSRSRMLGTVSHLLVLEMWP